MQQSIGEILAGFLILIFSSGCLGLIYVAVVHKQEIWEYIYELLGLKER